MKWPVRSTRRWDVFLVRKLGIPGHEQLAMGAVATGGVRALNEQVVRALRIPDYVIDAVAAKEEHELARRERLYRGDRPPPDVRGRTVILVDDGLATGATMHAAIQAQRQQQPAHIVVAVPTASPETCDGFREEDARIPADSTRPALSQFWRIYRRSRRPSGAFPRATQCRPA